MNILKFKYEKILVSGGAGFLGSHLCSKLLDKGNKVICLDNFHTGNKKNIDNLIDNKNFKLINHDIVDPIFIEVDEIYNLNFSASPIHYQNDPIKTIKTNVIGTINMLGLAKKANSKILQASTSEVYGDPQIHPQKETYFGNVNTIGIRACYDEGKRAAETLFFDYHREYSINIKVMRIFNTYGPNMHPNDGRVVSNFIVQALSQNDITIYGDGSQTRSFCYVDDLLEGMYRLMNSEDKVIGPINIGNPVEFTILELANKIIDLTGSSSKIIFKELPQDDPMMRKPDISLAKKLLEWSPKISLDEGLIKTVMYFKNIL